MATYQIIETNYAQDNGVDVKNQLGHYVKTVMQVKFVRDDNKESEVQRYEVDGDDKTMITEQLQFAADEYNTRII
jgi:hypothetical protein